MIQLIRTTHSTRPRDKGRPVLIIGQGEGKRVFHLSEAEVSQLKKAVKKIGE